MITENSLLLLLAPRDCINSLEPQIVPKGVSRLDGFDDKVVSLYARGMTVGEIQGHL